MHTFRIRPYVLVLAGGLVFHAGSQVQATPISAVEDGWDWFLDLFGAGSSDSGSSAPLPVDGPAPSSSPGDWTSSGISVDQPSGDRSIAGDSLDGGAISCGGAVSGGHGGEFEGFDLPAGGPGSPMPQGPAPAVPEPATLLLAVAGIAGMTALGRRGKRA
jgi:hypothetical protein